MTEIEQGDWVTINGCGPYKVNSKNFAGELRINVGTDTFDFRWVESNWCVKVPAPFTPEPGTYWLDSDSPAHTQSVWKVMSDGLQMRQLGHMDVALTLDYVNANYGPLTQLVPKEPPTETHSPDTLNKVFTALSEAGLTSSQAWNAVGDMQSHGIFFREQA